MNTSNRYDFYLTSLTSHFVDRDMKSVSSSEISNLPVDELTKLSYLNSLLHFYKGSLKDYSLIMCYRDELYRKHERSLIDWKMKKPVSKMNVVNKSKKVYV